MARILAIDDEKPDRDLLALHLIATGHSVAAVGSAAEALIVLAEKEFDLVISDLAMPRVNGLELLSAIRKQEKTRDLPFILVTRMVDDALLQLAIHYGATQYLTKPLDATQLTWEISKVLARAHTGMRGTH